MNLDLSYSSVSGFPLLSLSLSLSVCLSFPIPQLCLYIVPSDHSGVCFPLIASYFFPLFTLSLSLSPLLLAPVSTTTFLTFLISSYIFHPPRGMPRCHITVSSRNSMDYETVASLQSFFVLYPFQTYHSPQIHSCARDLYLTL